MRISTQPLIDFTSGAFRYRLDHLQGRNELLAKAIGYRSNTSLTLFDTTAGSGREAFLLAALGCNVTLFERHPLVANALEAALSHASTDPALASIVAKITLHRICAIKFFSETPTFSDVIYCDPMFSPRTKSAAVKKPLQQLQQWIGQDHDAEQLVSLALQYAKKRVVVKRALRDPPLVRPPTFSLKASSHRFDVYMNVNCKSPP